MKTVFLALVLCIAVTAAQRGLSYYPGIYGNNMHDNYDDDDNMYGGMWFLKSLWFKLKIRLIEYW